MDGKINVATDALPQGSEQLVESAVSPIENLRSARIDDYQREALAHGDALEASLGAANGGLLRMGLRLERFVETALEMHDRGGRPEGISRLLPALDAHLKVMRQVDRFAQLTRTRETRK